MKGVATPLLKAAKVRSWNAFARDTLSVSLGQRENIVFLTPMESRGPKNGFVEKQDSELSVAAGSAQEIGAKLREALKLAN